VWPSRWAGVVWVPGSSEAPSSAVVAWTMVLRWIGLASSRVSLTLSVNKTKGKHTHTHTHTQQQMGRAAWAAAICCKKIRERGMFSSHHSLHICCLSVNILPGWCNSSQCMKSTGLNQRPLGFNLTDGIMTLSLRLAKRRSHEHHQGAPPLRSYGYSWRRHPSLPLR